jgi:hypothetical protein
MHSSNIQHRARSAASGETMEKIARIGYLTKAVLYVIIGVVAIQAALEGGRAEGSKGVMQMIAEQPFGRFLLGATMVGLFAYALYRAVEAVLDPWGHRGDDKRWMKRIGFGVSAVIHASLGVWAASYLFGSGGTSGGGKEAWTARLLAAPGGQLLVGAIGVIVLGVAFAQVRKAYRQEFMQNFDRSHMSQNEVKAARGVGIAGLVARGFVFALMGWFLIRAAVRFDPNEVEGLGGVLRSIATAGYGPWLLAFVAVGLLAYGIYCAFMARYGRIQSAST